MKKIFIIALIISILTLVGCVNLDEFMPIEDYENKVSELEEANNTIGIRNDNIADLEEEVGNLEEDLDLTEEELIKYKSLINNLNELLSNVYYMEYENSEYTNWGTGFSIEYQDKYYILTAGHYVEDTVYNTGRYYNFKFKVNDKWIYPKLLAYKNDYIYYNDYAIFYSDKIKKGLKIDYDNDYSRFLLGTINNDLNVIRENKNWGKGGECGSPAIDLDGEVTAIFIGYITPIERVIEAIDNLK